jgi:protein ImuA
MTAPSSPRNGRIAALRIAVHAIEAEGTRCAQGHLSFGLAALDRRLKGGGLALAALHECAGARPGLADEAAASLFLAALAARRAGAGGTVLWALGRRDLFAPALAQAGLTPERLLYAECGNDEDVLAVMEEGLRHGGLAAVVGEVGRAQMAATRRLQLAAEQGGTLALMLKRWRNPKAEPLALPSAARTRWRIGCLPSAELPVPGVGRPRWRLTLARQRGGEPCEWIVESPDAKGRLALPAFPSHRSPAADRGEERRAA